MRQAMRVAALVVASVVIAMGAPASVAGVWQFTVELEMGTGRPVVTFKQDGEKLTGSYEGRYGASQLEGTVKENKIEFSISVVAEGTTVTGTFTGTYADDKMSGEVEYEGAGGGSWTAVRIRK